MTDTEAAASAEAGYRGLRRSASPELAEGQTRVVWDQPASVEAGYSSSLSPSLNLQYFLAGFL